MRSCACPRGSRRRGGAIGHADGFPGLGGVAVAAIVAAAVVVVMLNVKAVNGFAKSRFAAWYTAKEEAFPGQQMRGYLPVPIVDGSVTAVAFSLGPHKARFSVHDGGDASHLRPFLHKLGIWMAAVKKAAMAPSSGSNEGQ